MAMYATPTELAGYLQRDLDTYSATQALTLGSAEFNRQARTAFAATTVTWAGVVAGDTEVELPYSPVTAVSAVRINGVVVTGWSLRANTLYRVVGFGGWYAWPPDAIAVDLTYGYTAVPDEVKLAVLEVASGFYENPTGVTSESVDDYRVTYSGTPILPGRPWRDVAADYRELLVA